MDMNVYIMGVKVGTKRWITNITAGTYDSKTGIINDCRDIDNECDNIGEGLLIDDPQGTDSFTSDQLREIGLEGLYEIIMDIPTDKT